MRNYYSHLETMKVYIDRTAHKIIRLCCCTLRQTENQVFIGYKNSLKIRYYPIRKYTVMYGVSEDGPAICETCESILITYKDVCLLDSLYRIGGVESLKTYLENELHFENGENILTND